MKYYHAEHDAAYKQIARRGLTQWNDLFDDTRADDFGAFSNRRFLEDALPRLDLPAPPDTQVLEYGCGTGPATCFLAERGYRVHAIDLVPDAITLARRFAGERGLSIRFEVADVCDLVNHPPARRYDLIIDSYCLQSIVTDADRDQLFAGVRARLGPDAYYLVSTAMYESDRTYDQRFHYDECTGICYEMVPDNHRSDDAVELDGAWYQPHRRHLKPAALRRELTQAGFHVRSQEGPTGGDLVCTRLPDACN